MNAFASGSVALSLLLAFDVLLSPGLLARDMHPIDLHRFAAARTTLLDEFVRDLRTFFVVPRRASNARGLAMSGRTASTLANAVRDAVRSGPE